MQRAECWEAEGGAKEELSEISIGMTWNCGKTQISKSKLKKVIKWNGFLFANILKKIFYDFY